MMQTTLLLALALPVSLGALVGTQWPACTFQNGNLTYDVTALQAQPGYMYRYNHDAKTTLYYNFCRRVGADFGCSQCTSGGCSSDAANIDTFMNLGSICYPCCNQYGNGSDVVASFTGGGLQVVFSPNQYNYPFRRTTYHFQCNPVQPVCTPQVTMTFGTDPQGGKKDTADITISCKYACGVPTPKPGAAFVQQTCGGANCSASCTKSSFPIGTCLAVQGGGSAMILLCDPDHGVVEVSYPTSNCTGAGTQIAMAVGKCLPSTTGGSFVNLCSAAETAPLGSSLHHAPPSHGPLVSTSHVVQARA
eukprot:Sspe_Gene.48050::Locus_24765_Transcript_1_1_Confidence_1.000_Length_1017::g.48050::m.48050